MKMSQRTSQQTFCTNLHLIVKVTTDLTFQTIKTFLIGIKLSVILSKFGANWCKNTGVINNVQHQVNMIFEELFFCVCVCMYVCVTAPAPDFIVAACSSERAKLTFV